jgi:hypothetical protein
LREDLYTYPNGISRKSTYINVCSCKICKSSPFLHSPLSVEPPRALTSSSMSNIGHRILNKKWLFLLSLFTLFRVLAFVGCTVFFILGAYQYNINYLIIAACCVGVLLLLQMIHSIESGKIVCPSCRSQVIRICRVAKHHEAKKFLGSYSLRVAVQVIFTNQFLCPYCNSHYQWRGKTQHSTRAGQHPS